MFTRCLLITAGLLCLLASPVVQAAARPECESQLEASLSAEVSAELQNTCLTGCNESEIAHAVEKSLEANLKKTPSLAQKAKGYAVVVATMVASAAASSYLTSALPERWRFLSQVVGQVSTLGIFVFGAPIWEPLSSGFRKFAFGMSAELQPKSAADLRLEEIWRQTQQAYSLNAQMSRNVVHSFLIGMQQNVQAAFEAMNAGNEALAADQIAITAVRMRRLFSDLSPTDAIIAETVRAGFTRHAGITDSLRAAVRANIDRADPDHDQESVRAYYESLLQAWLG